jgi:hypothetical protein
VGRAYGGAIANGSKVNPPMILNSVTAPVKAVGMKVLTDDPDWKRDVYEARALAMTFVGRYGSSSRVVAKRQEMA